MKNKIVQIAVIIVLSLVQNSFAGWQTISLGEGIYPNDMSFYDADNGVIAANGTIFYSTDGGLSWNEGITTNIIDSAYMALGRFTAIEYLDRNTIIAVGAYLTRLNSLVIKSTDGGVTWQKIYNEGSHGLYFIDLEVVNDNYMVTSSANGLLYSSKDQGVSWQVCSSSYPYEGEIFDIAATSEDHRFVATGHSVLGTQSDEFYLDIQDVFSNNSEKNVENIHAINKDTMLYTSSKGLFLTDNGGTTWEEVDHRLGGGISCINNDQFFYSWR
jgi:photosystem II stability/assembly factor-like uncharacterized protein